MTFYRDALGLAQIAAFDDHAGYCGAVLEVAAGVHLELTHHRDGSSASVPASDDLLVFYMASRRAHRVLTATLTSSGRAPVRLENSYWHERVAVGFRDPDDCVVVLFPGPSAA